ICRIPKMPVKWPFLGCANFDVPGRASLLAAYRLGASQANARSGTPDSRLKKICANLAEKRDANGRETKNQSNRRQTIREAGPRASLRRRQSGSRRRDQMSSFALMSSFTACGLALPPDAFIT